MKKPSLKHATCMYLHADGHAVVRYERTDRRAGRVHWFESFETIGVRALFTGRVILSSQSLIALALKSVRIEARPKSLEYGSENTRKQGIAMGFVSFWLPGIDDFSGLYFYESDLMSSSAHYQPNENTTWAETKGEYTWGYDHAKITHNPKDSDNA